MSKGKTLLIGLLVLALGLGTIFATYKKRNAEAAQAAGEVMTVQTDDAPDSKADGPEASDTVYEVTNGIMPGMYVGEEYLAKDELIHNDDGTVTWNGETWKRNTYIHAILCLGVDKKRNLKGIEPGGDTGATDGIFLIVHDTAHDLMKVIMIPRDSMLYIDIPGPDGTVTRSYDHLSLAFTDGEGREKSAEASLKAAEDLLCGLTINHYMAGDLAILAEVNDLVGGVTVTVPDDLTNVNPDWAEGREITLHGNEAERFIRYRDTNIDGSPVERMEQHKTYIEGFYDVLLEKSKRDSSIVAKLCDTIEKSIVSDMSKGEYERFALDGLSCGFDPQKDIVILPGTATTGEESGEIYDQYYVDYEQTIPMLLELFYRKAG